MGISHTCSAIFSLKRPAFHMDHQRHLILFIVGHSWRNKSLLVSGAIKVGLAFFMIMTGVLPRIHFPVALPADRHFHPLTWIISERKIGDLLRFVKYLAYCGIYHPFRYGHHYFG
jgi:hypothetical protein